MEALIIVLVWVILALFNIIKIQQTGEIWEDNFGIYVFGVICAPIFTFAAFVVFFIFKSWKGESK